MIRTWLDIPAFQDGRWVSREERIIQAEEERLIRVWGAVRTPFGLAMPPRDGTDDDRRDGRALRA